MHLRCGPVTHKRYGLLEDGGYGLLEDGGCSRPCGRSRERGRVRELDDGLRSRRDWERGMDKQSGHRQRVWRACGRRGARAGCAGARGERGGGVLRGVISVSASTGVFGEGDAREAPGGSAGEEGRATTERVSRRSVGEGDGGLTGE